MKNKMALTIRLNEEQKKMIEELKTLLGETCASKALLRAAKTYVERYRDMNNKTRVFEVKREGRTGDEEIIVIPADRIRCADVSDFGALIFYEQDIFNKGAVAAAFQKNHWSSFSEKYIEPEAIDVMEKNSEI